MLNISVNKVVIILEISVVLWGICVLLCILENYLKRSLLIDI